MEYWDIYDENKQLTGNKMVRNDWNMKPDQFHLTVLGVIERFDGKFLITKRVETKSWAPGHWEVSGGGVMAGETSYEAVVREIKEEVGLDVTKAKGGYAFSYKRVNLEEKNNYFVDIYKFYMDFKEEDVKIQENEAAGFKLATRNEIKEIAQKGEFLHYDSIKNVFMENPQIFLIGFMGTGKSTVSKALAKILPYEIIEMDQTIVDEAKMPIAQIFEKYGENYFRDLETNLVTRISKSLEDGKKKIVSCGGGVVVRETNRQIMKQCGKIVLLTASPKTILDRVKDSDERPILNGNMTEDYIEKLMEKRDELYKNTADFAIKTDGKSAESIAEEIFVNLFK